MVQHKHKHKHKRQVLGSFAIAISLAGEAVQNSLLDCDGKDRQLASTWNETKQPLILSHELHVNGVENKQPNQLKEVEAC